MGGKTKSSKKFSKRTQSDAISSSGNGEGAAIATMSRSSGGGGAMAASTLQPHLGSSKHQRGLLIAHSPSIRSPPLHKQRSCNSSKCEQFPFSKHPNSKDALFRSSKHFVSAYSSFRARDNSSSDQMVLSNRQLTADDNMATGRGA